MKKTRLTKFSNIYLGHMKTENTTGSLRHDLQIQQIKTTQKTVLSKKTYKRKPRTIKHESN